MILDALKSILDLLGKGIYNMDLEKIKKERKIGRIGVKIFSIYTNINRVIHDGEDIIRLMRDFIKTYENSVGDRDRSQDLNTIVRSYLERSEKQIDSIKAVGKIILDFEKFLHIVDPDAYYMIEMITYGKYGNLTLIRNIITSRRTFFISVDRKSSINEDLIKYGAIAQNYNEQSYFGHHGIDHDQLYILDIGENNLYYENLYKIIKLYLSTYQPEIGISLLGEVADKLKDFIEHNFSMQDILIAIDEDPPRQI